MACAYFYRVNSAATGGLLGKRSHRCKQSPPKRSIVQLFEQLCLLVFQGLKIIACMGSSGAVHIAVYASYSGFKSITEMFLVKTCYSITSNGHVFTLLRDWDVGEHIATS